MTVELADRLPDLEAEAEHLERKSRALRQIVEGIKALNGDASAILFGDVATNGAPSKSDGPVGREAVRSIVSERPGIWKVAAIRDEAQARGYPISPMGIEKAVRRMMETGEAERVGYGRYAFRSRDRGEAFAQTDLA